MNLLNFDLLQLLRQIQAITKQDFGKYFLNFHLPLFSRVKDLFSHNFKRDLNNILIMSFIFNYTNAHHHTVKRIISVFVLLL